VRETVGAPREEVSMPFPVSIVGAGPGDPDLLTVKALRLIQSADAVVYDKLVSDAILDLIPAGATRIFAGKTKRNHHMPQEDTNTLLASLWRAGHRVVRLKGGDPFVFGRGGEEALHLARCGVPFEIVPGITSSAGCAAYAGIPLTHRGLSHGVRFVTGHTVSEDPDDLNWSSLADPDTTLVVYMGLSTAEIITQKLIDHGMPADLPAAAINLGTRPDQHTVLATLRGLAPAVRDAGLSGATLLVIGRVAALAEELAWFRHDPLAEDPADETKAMRTPPRRADGIAETALVVAGHGSSGAPEAAESVHAQVRTLAARGGAPVTAGFLKQAPYLADAVADALATGAARVIVVPFTASNGYVATMLMPRALGPLADDPRVRFADAVGSHPAIARAAAADIAATMAAYGLDPGDTHLLAVGHGTRRNPANARTTARFARTVADRLAAGVSTDIALLETDPPLPAWNRRTERRHVFVLPFFMAGGPHGHVDVPRGLGLDPVGHCIAELRDGAPWVGPFGLRNRRLWLARPVGFLPAAADAVAQRAADALTADSRAA
jgi:uroporphyrin-III C-methyltransferase